MTDAPTRPRPRRHDPDRRERIVAAALAVIAADGVAGVTHRKVAAAADVPLGSMTYHFAGMDDLLRAAFRRHADTMAERFERRLSDAAGRGEALDALVAVVLDDVLTSADDLVLNLELYTLAAREPAFRAITDAWMARSRAVLAEWFDPRTARVLDALTEGLSIHRALGTTRVLDDTVAAAFVRAATVSPTEHA